MSKSWPELRETFSSVVFLRGVNNVADAIPADRATVYRLIKGETRHPTRAILAGIERVIEQQEDEESHGRH
mgnify:CR=1 FL=1